MQAQETQDIEDEGMPILEELGGEIDGDESEDEDEEIIDKPEQLFERDEDEEN